MFLLAEDEPEIGKCFDMLRMSPDKKENRLNNSELWSGVVALALGSFVARCGYELGLGSITSPGSGYVLFYNGVLMCAFALSMLYSGARGSGSTLQALWAGTRWEKPVFIIVILLVYGVLFEPLGFLLATTLMMAALLRVIDPVRWLLAAPIAFGAPFAAWYLLEKVLLIQLPGGVLESITG